MFQQKALGRGLSSLIPSSGDKKAESSPYLLCSIDKIVSNRDQPRKLFDKTALEELADSIRENGVIQPLIVRKIEGGQFELIAGERRLKASSLAGLEQVPVVILETSADQNLELALIENIQRQDLNPIEEALAYKQLMERYHHTQEQCAKRVGKDRSTVANSIRLLSLSEEIRGDIIEGRISMGHARAILGIEEEEMQLKVARRAVQEGLSVREIEDWVRKLKEGVQVERVVKEKKIDPQLSFIENEMTKVLGTKVKIKPQGKKGKVVIDYYTQEDLDRIFNAVMG
jgi:ParB family transcriptional regulator, chromosome partitioning protein